MLLILLALLSGIAKAQYPFEKYPVLHYKACNEWKTTDRLGEKEKEVISILSLPGFYDNSDTLAIELTSFADHYWDHSIVRLLRNHTEVKKTTEDIAFNPIALDTVRVADINGDGLQDVKIIVYYMGNGTASLNVRVIYLFQQQDHSFTIISYDDKMESNRPERDVDGDGNYEIITMTLLRYEYLSYWLFNLFEYANHGLVNANQKANFHIMTQYLHRDNLDIINQISQDKIEKIEIVLPEGYQRK